MLLSALAPLLLAAATPTSPTLKLEADRPGQLRFEAGTLSAPYPGSLDDAARAYLATRRDLGLPSTSSLGTAKLFGTRFGTSVHLPQLVNGVPVDGARVVVSFDAQRRVVQVASSLVPYQSYTTHEVGWRQAIAIAGRSINGALRMPDGRFYGGATRLYVVQGDQARAAYLVFVPSLELQRNWHVAVDAATGDILYTQDRVFRAAQDAQVYTRSPGGLDAGVGVTATVATQLLHLDSSVDGGFLTGTQVVGFGCCTKEDCGADGGSRPKHIDGGFNYNGMNIPYDVAVCDREQRATNDPATHGSGDYVYAPTDPPDPICGSNGKCTVRIGDPADEDPFAEVHAYHHVNRIYDYVRALAGDAGSSFQLRDAVDGGRPVLWTNALAPDYEEALSNYFFTGKATSDNMVHVDNAAFMPRDEPTVGQQLPTDYAFTVDALVFWQGDKADFAYDAPVVWHEFGHAMLYSVGLTLDGVAFDSRSANNETGAMHEGLADWLAAVYGNDPRVGEYVGPRATGATAQGVGDQTPADLTLRTADNTHRCPEVLWGEVHQDGMHVTGALWQARKELFQGSDQGQTFDAVVYAAIVSLPPKAGFADLASAVATRVQGAFPLVADAQGKVQAIFDARGVTNCSKVLDITGLAAPQREVFGIASGVGANLAATVHVPGPLQFKFSLPTGAKAVSVSFPVQGSLFGTTTPKVKLLAKASSPITFTKTSTSVTADTALARLVSLSSGNAVARQTVDVPCNGELYVALTAAGGHDIRDLSLSVEPADACLPVDAGTGVDAGAPDAGTPAKTFPNGIAEGGAGAGGPAVQGCGCGAADAGMALFALLALVGFARRRRG